MSRGLRQPSAKRGADFGGPLQHGHVAAVGYYHELATGDLGGRDFGSHWRVVSRPAPSVLAVGEHRRRAADLFRDRARIRSSQQRPYLRGAALYY
jgi:hypothetical protein